MPPEIHLFLIWSNARPTLAKILEDLRERFEVLTHVDIRWSAEKFASNMTRFYGVNLPSRLFDLDPVVVQDRIVRRVRKESRDIARLKFHS